MRQPQGDRLRAGPRHAAGAQTLHVTGPPLPPRHPRTASPVTRELLSLTLLRLSREGDVPGCVPPRAGVTGSSATSAADRGHSPGRGLRGRMEGGQRPPRRARAGEGETGCQRADGVRQPRLRPTWQCQSPRAPQAWGSGRGRARGVRRREGGTPREAGIGGGPWAAVSLPLPAPSRSRRGRNRWGAPVRARCLL